jgi:LCP family protein required for cell wall assembly
MGNRRIGDDAPGPRSSHRGLRSLGDQIDGRTRGDRVPNERGLAALGDAVDRSRGRAGAAQGGRGGAAQGGRAGAAQGGRGGPRGPGGGGRGPNGSGNGSGHGHGYGTGDGGRRRRSGRRRWSTRRKVLTPLISLLVLALVAAGGLYAYARYRYDQIPKVTVAAEHQASSGQPFNMLVIGSDTRVGARANTGIGTTTTVGGQRSDVIMVWHVVPTLHKITILSIPRDTLTQMEGKNATAFGRLNRINASFNDGVNLLVETIQDNFGIPINHVIQVDFEGFKGAVNALGGVYMNFPHPAKDAYSGLNITTPGCQILNGTQALAVARSRHYQYEVNDQWVYTGISDLGRIKRQDAFLRSLVDAAKSKYNPLQLNAFLGSLPQGLVVDKTFSLSDMVGLAEEFHSITPKTIQTYTLPTTTAGAVTPWGDVLFVNQPADQELLVKIFGNELMHPTTPPPNTTLQPETPPAVSATTSTTTSAPSTTTAASPTKTPTFDPTPCSP